MYINKASKYFAHDSAKTSVNTRLTKTGNLKYRHKLQKNKWHIP